MSIEKALYLLRHKAFVMVEAGRVELPSESTSTGTSPSADDPLHSLTQAWVVTLLSLVES